MIVKNLLGTSDEKCNCESWKEHYEKFSGHNPTFCIVIGCMNKVEVGAHVKKLDILMKPTGKALIMPFCKSCNAKSESLIVPDGVYEVSADKSETCNKLDLRTIAFLSGLR